MNEHSESEEFWRYADPPEAPQQRSPFDRAFGLVVAAILIATLGVVGFAQLGGQTESVTASGISESASTDLLGAATLPGTLVPEIVAAPTEIPAAQFVPATATPIPPAEPTPEPTAVPPTPVPAPTSAPAPTAAPTQPPAPTEVPLATATAVPTESATEASADATDGDAADGSDGTSDSDSDDSDAGDGTDSTDGDGSDAGDSTDGDDGDGTGADGSDDNSDNTASTDNGSTDTGDNDNGSTDNGDNDSSDNDSGSLGALPSSGPDADEIARVENEMIAWINGVRTNSGSGQVAFHNGLANRSRVWSEIMGEQFGTIVHCDDVDRCGDAPMPSSCTVWGENVAQGTDLGLIRDALLDSPPHLDNMQNASYTNVGVGATYRDGSWWITQSFGAC